MDDFIVIDVHGDDERVQTPKAPAPASASAPGPASVPAAAPAPAPVPSSVPVPPQLPIALLAASVWMADPANHRAWRVAELAIALQLITCVMLTAFVCDTDHAPAPWFGSTLVASLLFGVVLFQNEVHAAVYFRRQVMAFKPGGGGRWRLKRARLMSSLHLIGLWYLAGICSVVLLGSTDFLDMGTRMAALVVAASTGRALRWWVPPSTIALAAVGSSAEQITASTLLGLGIAVQHLLVAGTMYCGS